MDQDHECLAITLCHAGQEQKALEQEKLLLPKRDMSETSTPRVPSGKMSHWPVLTASCAGTRWLHTPVGLLSTGWGLSKVGALVLATLLRISASSTHGVG